MGRVASAWAVSLSFARRWAPKLLRGLLITAVLFLGLMAFVAFVVLYRQGDLPTVGPELRVVLGLGLLALLVLSIWLVPVRQARAVGAELTARERAELTDRFRRTLAGLIGGAVLAIVLLNGVQTAKAMRAAALGDQFATATLQLAGDRVATRTAGVYLMESIARADAAMRSPAYETLIAFARDRAREPWGLDSLTPPSDLLAAAAVIARREAEFTLHPDFSEANLRGATLPDAQWDHARLVGTHLQRAELRGARIAGRGGADLRGVRLDSADLSRAHLDGARLTDGAVLFGANLRGTDLDGASLRGADLRNARMDSAGLAGASLVDARLDSASLRGADLSGATLHGAVLAGADFAGATLTNANLQGVDLSAARNLTSAQIAPARLDAATRVPVGVQPPRPSARPD